MSFFREFRSTVIPTPVARLATFGQRDFALLWFGGLISVTARKGPELEIPTLEASLLPGCSTACDGPVDRKEYDRADGGD